VDVRGSLRAALAVVVTGGCAGTFARAAPGVTPGVPASGAPRAPWFEDVTERAGVDFVYEAGAHGQFLLPEIMGGGAALFDYDGDGDLDLYLTNGNDAASAARPEAVARDRLYRQGKDGRFEDVTVKAGVGDTGYGMGVAVGDYDNDGDLDLYVTNYGRDLLYRNGGDGTFEDVTARAGVAVAGWSSSAAFFDYDRDGFLDLFVARYVEYDPKKSCTDAAGRPDYCSPKMFPTQSDVLLHNDGDGTFTDVSAASGIVRGSGAGLGVTLIDADDDGWPDMFVANDGSANQLWLNQRDGTFRDGALLLGVAYNLHGAAEAGMGVVAADLDSDLRPDLFITHLGNETNTFYRNLGGKNGFEDRSGASGLATAHLTGFGTAALDVELDGDLDLVIANGRVTRGKARGDTSVGPPWDAFAEPNLLYLNRGSAAFVKETEAGRAFTTPLEVSRAAAIGDIDSDGDVDIVVANIGSRARLYANRADRAGHWLGVRAVDPRYRRDAVGAEITVVPVGGSRRRGWVNPGCGYLGSNDPRVHFGLGQAASIESVMVEWPDGSTESFTVPGIDRYVTLVRGTGKAGP
jgi:hypothetical protein